jgi:hypothetical protein
MPFSLYAFEGDVYVVVPSELLPGIAAIQTYGEPRLVSERPKLEFDLDCWGVASRAIDASLYAVVTTEEAHEMFDFETLEP